MGAEVKAKTYLHNHNIYYNILSQGNLNIAPM